MKDVVDDDAEKLEERKKLFLEPNYVLSRPLLVHSYVVFGGENADTGGASEARQNHF